MPRVFALTAVAASLLLLSPPARADGAPAHLGEAGHVVWSLPRLVSALALEAFRGPRPSDAPSGTSLVTGAGTGTSVYGLPRVGVDWVFARSLTVGTELIASATFGGAPGLGDPPRVSAYGLFPRAGFVTKLATWADVWLRAGPAVYRLEAQGVNGTAATPVPWSYGWTQLDLDAEAQLVLAALPRVAVTASLVAEVPVSGRLDETRGISGAASWLHVGLVGGLLLVL